MERVRQAEIRRQLDLVAKVTLVNNMKVNIEEVVLFFVVEVVLFSSGIPTTSSCPFVYSTRDESRRDASVVDSVVVVAIEIEKSFGTDTSSAIER